VVLLGACSPVLGLQRPSIPKIEAQQQWCEWLPSSCGDNPTSVLSSRRTKYGTRWSGRATVVPMRRSGRKGGKGTDRVVLMNGMVVDRKELVHHVAIEACDDLITSGTPLPTPVTMPPSDEDEDDVDYVEVEASSEPSVPRQASPTMLRAASSSPTKQNRGRVSTLTHSLTHSLTRSLTCTLASG
jgi:hypothetical protein